jgi:vacuolar iron transporter family protein
VLGSDDAIVSTASLMLGMAAASATKQTTLLAGVAGLVAGSMSMAAGEYVSVSSQRDTEQADIALEHRELQEDARGELRELAGIYVKRGLDRDLAMKVAEQLSAKDRLGAHLRDELGIAGTNMARPLQAAGASALSFAVSGLLPILALLAAPAAWRIPVVACVSLACLAVLGALGGRLGGAAQGRAAIRVVLGGTLAMAVTAAVGRLFGVSAG